MSAPSHTGRHLVAGSCPVCGSASWTPLVDGGPAGFEWVRCECSVVFKRSEPAAPALHADGGGGEASREQRPGDADAARAHGHYDSGYFARYARRRRHRIAKSRRQILDALEIAPRGRLLDVGCSLGYTLEAARSLGLEAAGADVSVHAVDECRRLGFDARRGSLEALPFEDATFALAVLKHVFEHTAAPRAALAELRRVLLPGAALFLAVPNLGYFKAARSPGTSRFFRGEAGRAHYVYYSPATLAGLLAEEGFRVVGVHPRLLHRRAGWLRLIADAVWLPARLPVRALADALGLRKEFWLVAVRT